MKFLITVLFVVYTLPSFAQTGIPYTIEFIDERFNEVTVSVDFSTKLKKTDTLFQFASTAPGTYQKMDMGRYVTKFEVFDKKGTKQPGGSTED